MFAACPASESRCDGSQPLTSPRGEEVKMHFLGCALWQSKPGLPGGKISIKPCVVRWNVLRETLSWVSHNFWNVILIVSHCSRNPTLVEMSTSPTLANHTQEKMTCWPKQLYNLQYQKTQSQQFLLGSYSVHQHFVNKWWMVHLLNQLGIQTCGY